jgi:hypothetical protein
LRPARIVPALLYFLHHRLGLYRYNINDLVEVVGFQDRTPIIQFIRKGTGISSVTGEKLTEEQVHVALTQALKQVHLPIDHCTLAVEMGYPPHYVFYVEPAHELSEPDRQAFLSVFEQSLRQLNIEYEDKRSSRRLGPPEIQIVPRGTFTRLRQMRVAAGAPEAQVKIPLLDTSLQLGKTMSTFTQPAPTR